MHRFHRSKLICLNALPTSVRNAEAEARPAGAAPPLSPYRLFCETQPHRNSAIIGSATSAATGTSARSFVNWRPRPIRYRFRPGSVGADAVKARKPMGCGIGAPHGHSIRRSRGDRSVKQREENMQRCCGPQQVASLKARDLWVPGPDRGRLQRRRHAPLFCEYRRLATGGLGPRARPARCPRMSQPKNSFVPRQMVD